MLLLATSQITTIDNEVIKVTSLSMIRTIHIGLYILKNTGRNIKCTKYTCRSVTYISFTYEYLQL